MALTINGKKVLGYALGDTEFYSIDAINASDPLEFTYNTSTTPYGVDVSLSQQLASTSTLTIKDLIDKGEKIRLILTFYNTSYKSYFSLASGIVDLSKPDSNGHFNFQWRNGATQTNTYCCSVSSTSKFTIYSSTINTYPTNGYTTPSHMIIIYSDES
jgi:hypothetical protein